MNELMVRKKKAHRIGIRCLALLDCLAFFLLLWLSQDFLLGLLMFVLTQSPMAWILLYYESWAIVFRKNEIQRRCWGRLHSYAWTDVREVTSFRSATEGPCILLRFRDGRHFQFRIEDENGVKALGLITKHTSIVSK